MVKGWQHWSFVFSSVLINSFQILIKTITMDNLEANIMDKSMRSVFVGNIPYEATEEKLKDIFGEVGQVLSFKLVFDRETGKPKGYGFCEYRDQETALSAMRNLNGYEIGGRNLRVDNACTEKSRMEMQNLLNQPPVENPYGEPIQAEKAPEAISKAVASLPPEQMFELMKQMKLCIQNNPTEARQMLLQNPQLAYALLQAQVVMRIIDPQTAATMLHPQNPVPSTLTPKEKTNPGPVSINSNYTGNPTPVQPPRPEFQPVPAPALHNNSNPVFTGQDVDLRSLDPRGADPRLSRLGDQDMRTLPGQLPNPLPPPLVENFNRDPRGGPGSFPSDPRQQQRVDPRQKNMPPQQNSLPPQPVRAPQGPPSVPQVPRPAASVASSIGGTAGASDQEKAALIMQVLQLSDEQIAMLPPEQRNSILVLKEQIAKSAHR
ncbi:cleavage stimulation factor subunit 2 tau variant isoform X2 [Tribolium madens]|uniref:cleavage stimulation factor subunit 2 tau variant isoform X2 n=1 Tax=Tribolium madens TaxID=41895 RepID=UPI001CF737BB|nr:cleavage stimulation factor subunit 2 tau variant isoform X2 [Tribolium madens]